MLLFKDLKFHNVTVFIWPNNNMLINPDDLNYIVLDDVQPTQSLNWLRISVHIVFHRRSFASWHKPLLQYCMSSCAKEFINLTLGEENLHCIQFSMITPIFHHWCTLITKNISLVSQHLLYILIGWNLISLYWYLHYH